MRDDTQLPHTALCRAIASLERVFRSAGSGRSARAPGARLDIGRRTTRRTAAGHDRADARAPARLASAAHDAKGGARLSDRARARPCRQIGRAHAELQSLMSIQYADFRLKKKKKH